MHYGVINLNDPTKNDEIMPSTKEMRGSHGFKNRINCEWNQNS
jgi:hypothetical protein